MENGNEFYSESKYSVGLLSCKYLVNCGSNQRRDFSVEFIIEIEFGKFYMHLKSDYGDIRMKVSPQSIWIHCS